MISVAEVEDTWVSVLGSTVGGELFKATALVAGLGFRAFGL